jgi:hypothetical protein
MLDEKGTHNRHFVGAQVGGSGFVIGHQKTLYTRSDICNLIAWLQLTTGIDETELAPYRAAILGQTEAVTVADTEPPPKG